MTVLVMQPPTLPQMFQEGIPHRRGYGSPQPPPQPLQESTTLPSIRDTFPGFDKADFSDDTSEPASSRDTSAPAAATSLNTSPNAGSIPVATTAEYTHTPSSGHKRHRGPSDDDDSASRRLSQVPRRFDVPHHIEYVEPLSGGRPLPRASEVPSSAVFAPSIDSTAATWPEQQPGRHLPRLRFDREPPASSPHPRAYASDSHPAYHGHPSSSASCNYPGGQHVGPAPHYHGHAGGSGSYHRQSMSAGSIHGFDSAAFPPSSASRSPPSQSMHYHHHSYLEHHHGVVPYYAGGPDYIPAENMMGGNHRSMVGYGPGGGSMGGGGMRTGDSRQRKRRGNLPKETTDKLRSWFITHLHHPYPSEDEKQELMRQTGLQMNQISNWFINARRRQLPTLMSNARAENDAMAQGVPPSSRSSGGSGNGSGSTVAAGGRDAPHGQHPLPQHMGGHHSGFGSPEHHYAAQPDRPLVPRLAALYRSGDRVEHRQSHSPLSDDDYEIAPRRHGHRKGDSF